MIIGTLMFVICLFAAVILYLLLQIKKIDNCLEFLANRAENSKLRNDIIDPIHERK